MKSIITSDKIHGRDANKSTRLFFVQHVVGSRIEKKQEGMRVQECYNDVLYTLREKR